LSEEQIDLRQMLERREREYLLGSTRTRMRSSVENLDVGDFHIEKLAQGESVELPRWVADELVGQGMAETAEAPFENEIFNALSKEKMMGPLQLSTLTPDFYVRMRRRLNSLGAGVAGGMTRREDFERLRAVCYDLVGIRLSKLLALSSSSTPASTLGERLTPEESAFFALSQSLSKEWKAGLLGGAK
jgi:GINS complex protein helical bundle domain